MEQGLAGPMTRQEARPPNFFTPSNALPGMREWVVYCDLSESVRKGAILKRSSGCFFNQEVFGRLPGLFQHARVWEVLCLPPTSRRAGDTGPQRCQTSQ